MTRDDQQDGLPERPELEPERTVDELERRVRGSTDELSEQDDPADGESNEPIIEQDLDPDEEYTPEPPA